jgi:hypothetical protein
MSFRMSNFKLLFALAVAATTVAVGFKSVSSHSDLSIRAEMSGHWVPVVLVQTDGTHSPNTVDQFRVDMNDYVDADQAVSISINTSGAYTNLPTSVTVPAGQKSVTFSATVSNNPPSSWTLSASANGTTVTCGQLIPPPTAGK